MILERNGAKYVLRVLSTFLKTIFNVSERASLEWSPPSSPHNFRSMAVQRLRYNSAVLFSPHHL